MKRRISMQRPAMALAGFVAMGAVGTTVWGEDYIWNNPAGGTFSDGSNWQGGISPLSSNSAVFSLPTTYTVGVSADVSLDAISVQRGDVFLDLQDHQVHLSREHGSPSLLIGSDAKLMIGSGKVESWRGVDSTGELVLASGAIVDSCSVSIRGGKLLIENGAVLTGCDPSGGVSAGASAIVKGTWCTWTMGANNIIVSDGGYVCVGDQFYGSGTITDSGSRLICFNSLGNFNISSGGKVLVGNTYGGSSVVNGSGSVMSSYLNCGTIDVSNGAYFSCYWSIGSIHVSDVGSSAYVQSGIGYPGSLFVNNGASATISDVHDGGTATVSGIGSKLFITYGAFTGSRILVSDGSEAICSSPLLWQWDHTLSEGDGTISPSPIDTNVFYIGYRQGGVDNCNLGYVDVTKHGQLKGKLIDVGYGALTVSDGGLVTADKIRVQGLPDAPAELVVKGLSLVKATSVEIDSDGSLSGDGLIDADLVNNGLIKPGASLGTLCVGGNYVQKSAGVLMVDIAGMNSYDQVNITGDALLDGTLEVSFLDGFSPAPGSKFTILSAHSINGSFASHSSSYEISYEAGAVIITAVPEPLALPFILLVPAGLLRRKKK